MTQQLGLPLDEQFLADVQAGLGAAAKSIPCKYFYDRLGSELFEAICATPEYYVTRADLEILDSHLGEIAALAGPGVHVIEFGSGAGIKTRHLLAALDRPVAYTPIEISRAALDASARALGAEFPGLDIRPLAADYTQPVPPGTFSAVTGRRLVYFPGSTIGNFDHHEAAAFLHRICRIIRPDGALLIGVDLKKPLARLLPAYNDAAGVTAAFNLNLLQRINRELDGDFDPALFRHEARYIETAGRIEMHLVCRRAHQVTIAGRRFLFAAGESIHTENSYKYTIGEFTALAAAAGLEVQASWTDREALFSTHFCRVGGD